VVAQLFDLELSGLVFTGDQPELRRDRHNRAAERDPGYDDRYDFSTFIYDAFHDPDRGEVTLLCPPLLNFRNLLDDVVFGIDGAVCRPSSVSDVSRCSLISFAWAGDCPQTITLSHPQFGANLVIGRSYLDEFEGKNVVFTISRNNRLEWICDWLNYYVKVHGANAVVLSDNNSTAYSAAELGDAIRNVPGIEVAAILRARYPFGPTDSDSYGALFLQRSLAELCRRRFLGRARAVVGADIDELFHSYSGASIFDATVASEAGYIRADAEWVYTDQARDEGSYLHKNHGFVSANGKPKANRKWCVAPTGPQKDRQWLTHFLGSRKDPVDPDFRMWHFGQISTSWKYDRAAPKGPDLSEDKILQKAMQVFGDDAP
jgi:hypothetical protein